MKVKSSYDLVEIENLISKKKIKQANDLIKNIISSYEFDEKDFLRLLVCSSKTCELENFIKRIRKIFNEQDLEIINNLMIKNIVKIFILKNVTCIRNSCLELIKNCKKDILGSIIVGLTAELGEFDKEHKLKFLNKSYQICSDNLDVAKKLLDQGVEIKVVSISDLLKLNKNYIEKISFNDINPRIDLKFTPLGGGNEVGRSSYLLEVDGNSILIDAGIKISSTEIQYPNFQYLIDNKKINDIKYVVITHAHLDHCGAIEKLYNLNPKIKFIMTEETKKLIWASLKGEYNLIEDNLKLDMILNNSIILKFREEFFVSQNMKLSLFRAGHILGASAILFETERENIFFTGDYCLTNRSTVNGMDIPIDKRIDVLITETTYGDKFEENNIESSKVEFKNYIRKCMREGKQVLIPAFAL